jgi:hypothetical protein
MTELDGSPGGGVRTHGPVNPKAATATEAVTKPHDQEPITTESASQVPRAEPSTISVADLMRFGIWDPVTFLRGIVDLEGLGVIKTVPGHADAVAGLVNLFEGTMMSGELMSNTQEWIDVEFEVCLDSGCTDNVCAPSDVPGYACEASAGSRAGQHFIVGNGARIPNKGQACLNLASSGDGPCDMRTTFQIAAVSRPLMSVGRICDADLLVAFKKEKARIIDERNGRVVAEFARQPGGLYIAKLRLKAPAAPFPRPA